jgi:hypothetical protein
VRRPPHQPLFSSRNRTTARASPLHKKTYCSDHRYIHNILLRLSYANILPHANDPSCPSQTTHVELFAPIGGCHQAGRLAVEGGQFFGIDEPGCFNTRIEAVGVGATGRETNASKEESSSVAFIHSSCESIDLKYFTLTLPAFPKSTFSGISDLYLS